MVGYKPQYRKASLSLDLYEYGILVAAADKDGHKPLLPPTQKNKKTTHTPQINNCKKQQQPNNITNITLKNYLHEAGVMAIWFSSGSYGNYCSDVYTIMTFGTEHTKFGIWRALFQNALSVNQKVEVAMRMPCTESCFGEKKFFRNMYIYMQLFVCEKLFSIP